ncbi:MAG: zinc dependent phospholipase C family protein [Rhodospirillales bacterium]|nr:zinc dependent phospholipase C family protein [Rhodospirillales bacterium]
MAGGYTHLTLVRSALTDKMTDRKLGPILNNWGQFTYLGAVSPDYPYLAGDDAWADDMHKGGTDKLIQAALEHLFKFKGDGKSEAWRKQVAWLFGFVAHVIADVTIHPVVNARVGRYEEFKKDHRICEMNQDTWIYNEEIKADIHNSDEMRSTILLCGSKKDMNDVVEEIWRIGFLSAYGKQPDDGQIDKWNGRFIDLINTAAKTGDVPILGRMLAGQGLAYPKLGNVDLSFILNLAVPTSKEVNEFEQPIDKTKGPGFADVFGKTLRHVKEAWDVLRDDLLADTGVLGKKHETVFENWSLDTGITLDGSRKLRLWPFDEKLVRS